MDARTIAEALARPEWPEGISRKDLDRAIREMSAGAYRRLVVNQSGALPFLPLPGRSATRALLDLAQRWGEKFSS